MPDRLLFLLPRCESFHPIPTHLDTGGVKKLMELTEQQIAEFREAFSLFDKDRDGNITNKELGTVMRSLGQNPTETELANALVSLGNGDGKIGFTDFMRVMSNQMADKTSEKKYIESFAIFDEMKNGTISAAELRYILNNLGEKLPEEEINEMICMAEIDSDGLINYREFVRIMLSK
jgi:calmodulin